MTEVNMVFDPVSGEMRPDYVVAGEPDITTPGHGAIGTDVGATDTTIPTVTTPSISDDDDDVSPDITDEVVEEAVPSAPDDEWFERPEDVPIPGYDPSAIAPVKIDEAPAYEQSEEQKEWARMHSAQIQDIIDKKGIGIDEATQQLMKQQTWDLIKADRNERIRKLKETMEQRGITSSGLYISEEMKVHANATRALAASVTEVKIKSAFMKMASFENALGLSGQFLGYLSEQSQLAYAPKLATWSKRADAKIMAMQASVEIYKVKLQQAYAVNNMNAQAAIEAQFATQQHTWDVEIAEMEMEFAEEQAKADRAANIFGTILGAVSGLF